MKITCYGIYFVLIIFGLVSTIKATTSTESVVSSTESMTTTSSVTTTTTGNTDSTTTGNTISTTTDNTVSATTGNAASTTAGNTVSTTASNTDGSSTSQTVGNTMAMQNETSVPDTTTTDATSNATMPVNSSPATMMGVSSTAAMATKESTTSQTTKLTTMPTTPTTTTPPTTTTTTTTTPCPTLAAAGTSSDFGRVGFVAFGITFAIALILLVTLLIILIRRRQKSGEYTTGEGSSPRLMMDGLHMSMPMNNDLENVDTIDLDKADSDRKVGNGTGLSSFKTDEPQKTSQEGTASAIKREDSGSINNLLNEEDYDKKNADDQDDSDDKEDSENDEDTDSPAVFVGLKVEPSTGASVDSLRQVKETDKLMDNTSDGTPSIDDHLPPPSLSESESESSKEVLNEKDDVTEM